MLPYLVMLKDCHVPAVGQMSVCLTNESGCLLLGTRGSETENTIV